MTTPGWTVASGLPTVVRYGTAGYPLAGPGEEPGVQRRDEIAHLRASPRPRRAGLLDWHVG